VERPPLDVRFAVALRYLEGRTHEDVARSSTARPPGTGRPMHGAATFVRDGVAVFGLSFLRQSRVGGAGARGARSGTWRLTT